MRFVQHGLWPARARGRTLVRVLAIAAIALVAVPIAVWAHGVLKSSQPASGANLAVAPREIRLDFTEAPEVSVSRVELRGPDGQRVALGPLTTASDSRRSLVAAVRGPLGAGTYTIAWQIAGSDGHPVRGTFSFMIAAGAAGLGAAATPNAEAGRQATDTTRGQTPAGGMHHDPESMPTSGGFDSESAGYVVVRWLLFTGLLIVIGAVAFRYVVLGFLGRRQRTDAGGKSGTVSTVLASMGNGAAHVGLVATAVLLGATVLRLVAQSYAMHGAAGVSNLGLMGTMVGRTVWGWGWMLQLAGAILAMLGFARARRGSSAGWTIAAFGALVLAFTPGLSGHAAAAPRLVPLALLADGLHVIGAGGWLGSLLLVVAVGIPVALRLEESARGSTVADLVNAFSPTALVFAGLAAATGLFAAWLHIGSIPAIWQSTYGKTLLVKLAILSVVAATGAYNWLRVRPALESVDGAQRVRRSSMIELGVGVLVLVVTAILVATPPPMEMSGMSASTPPSSTTTSGSYP